MVSRDHAPPITAVTSGQSHSPAPWVRGWWSGKCYVPEHGICDHPGPGRGCVYEYTLELDPNGALVSATDHSGYLISDETLADMGEANARLIAAAPDLLEACRKALHLVGKMRSASNTDGVTSALLDAIRKAEGL